MEHTSPFVSGRRISGTLKLQSSALGAETAPRSQAPPTTVRPPDKWEVVEASLAAMTNRTRGGCVNRPGFTGGQNFRRIAHYGTDTKEEDLEAVFPRVP